MESLLVCRGASLCYRMGGAETWAVREATLGLAPGEILGVAGPSGNGKSSLLHILTGLRSPSAGRVAFAGQDYRELGPARLADLRRRAYGLVFQQHFLINYLSALENVLVGLAPGAPRQTGSQTAHRLLDGLGLTHLRHRFPHELSGGQRQLVALARALASAPRIVFADEPTAFLDRAAAARVVDALAAYRAGGGTIVLVSHDSEVLAAADRVLTMREGRLTAS